MKKALIIILAALFILGMTAVAYAADPVENTPHTFIETDPGRTANPPDVGAVPSDTLQPPLSALGSLSGASAWAYKDAADSATKFEGSYEAFQDTANNLYDFDNTDIEVLMVDIPRPRKSVRSVMPSTVPMALTCS